MHKIRPAPGFGDSLPAVAAAAPGMLHNARIDFTGDLPDPTEMAPHEIWFLLAFALLALEMANGTFTMLMLGVACGFGGGVALLGFGLPLQLAAVALAGVVGTLILRRSKQGQAAAPVLPDFDLGQPVHDAVWREDGSARVQYRGAAWEAELEPGAPASARSGPLYIVAIRGSTLLLGPRKP